MKSKLQRLLAGILLLSILLLLSSLQCNDEYDTEFECSQPSSYSSFNDELYQLMSYDLDPPKLSYGLGGPSNICTRKSVKVKCELLCKQDPPYAIVATCYMGVNRVVLNNYDTLNYSYTSGLRTVGVHSTAPYAGELGCNFEITWTPEVPFNSKDELEDFVYKYFDEINIQYQYYLFRP